MSFELAKEMDVNPNLLIKTNSSDEHDNQVIIEVNKEEAEQLLKDDKTLTTLKTVKKLTSPTTNFAADLTTINTNDFGSANYPHLVMIKAAYAVRNVTFLNKTDSIQVATMTCQARTNFHTRET